MLGWGAVAPDSGPMGHGAQLDKADCTAATPCTPDSTGVSIRVNDACKLAEACCGEEQQVLEARAHHCSDGVEDRKGLGPGGPRGAQTNFIPFSAFWLRSCVVSVLISLIAYMGIIDSLRLTLISLGANPMGVLASSERQDETGTALRPFPSTPIQSQPKLS